MIWIIGGTSDARKLINRLGDTYDYIVTIATQGGKDFFHGDNVRVGRLNKEQMLVFAQENKVDTLVDLSHPYAKEVSKNAKEVCEQLKIKYIRYRRKKAAYYKDGTYLPSYEATYDYLKTISGTVFFTTGSQNIGNFEKIKGPNRFIYRILPVSESINIGEKEQVHMRDIIAMLGPFSKDMNKQVFKDYKVTHCVLKDSGQAGGTEEKLQACKELDIEAIIIGREDESGIENIDQILDMLDIKY